MKYPKYVYPEPIPLKKRTWPERQITKAPVWTSVDLRDGNQALPIPMNPETKLDYFKLLVKIGFKEIEVGFPSASQDDFDFVRTLIEQGIVPDDVRISVLTQARPHLIEKTVEALKGARNPIIHCYVATSDLHGKFVFGREREQVKEMAVQGTQMIKAAVEAAGMSGKAGYEFSPEEFSDSDLDFVIDLCKAVKEAWGSSAKQDFILNLPATVERRPPNQYADMIEYFCENYPYLDETTISVHAHNDQGCAVAATELSLLAGAERVEGTIFGHGERTGNLDISTIALNLFSRGIDTGLDFSNMPEVVKTVEDASGIEVHPRHPYAGQLVFTAFSGSHQDAIRKGMVEREKTGEYFKQGWKVPYLHIDPADVGRAYEKLIRINSQSGKGGVAYILEKEFGIFAPKQMQPEIGSVVQDYLDTRGGEIGADELLEIFTSSFVNIEGRYTLDSMTRKAGNGKGDDISVDIVIDIDNTKVELCGHGNGPISAVTHALQKCPEVPEFVLEDFSERTLGRDANAKAIAFVGIRRNSDGRLIYGAGEHSNIDRAALIALFSALNRSTIID
ncbi:2-isopropylmalate synthase [Lentisphaerota bacterium ZTH]|nr:2-isopropylmalate synthase [Lentisphaerota bacterium]WET05766.1 2-isopropylmalate synthase [Lentisphaerota bacterium ZTH]